MAQRMCEHTGAKGMVSCPLGSPDLQSSFMFPPNNPVKSTPLLAVASIARDDPSTLPGDDPSSLPHAPPQCAVN